MGKRMLLARLGGVVCALALGAGCRVPAPTVEQGLAYGFHSPQQALESFRTAVQGNLLNQEYRCFSRGWKDRTKVKSINYYSEVRDELMARVPQLRWALHHAKDPEVIAEGDRNVLLQCRIPGPLWVKDRYLVFHMRREGFWRAWTDAKPEVATEGNTLPDPIAAGVLEYVDRYDTFRMNIDEFSLETDDLPPEAIIAAEGGWQWKIEDFNLYNEPTAPERRKKPVRAIEPTVPLSLMPMDEAEQHASQVAALR